MTEDRMMNVDWEQVDDRARRVTDIEWLQAEVERLTAELAEMTTNYKWWWGRCEDAEAREKALRAITGEMRQIERDPGLGKPPYLDALTEWDRRAATVT